MTRWDLRRRQWVAVVTPVVLIVSMYVAFQDLVMRLGFPHGYLPAFMIYWIGWCLALSTVLLGGPRAVLDPFRDTEPRFGKLVWKSLVLLLWPLPFPLVFRFIPNLPEANVAIVLASIAIGVVIGVTEEILWRGLYVRLFPDRVWLNHLYPSVAFALWHVAPQSVRSNTHARRGGFFRIVRPVPRAVLRLLCAEDGINALVYSLAQCPRYLWSGGSSPTPCG